MKRLLVLVWCCGFQAISGYAQFTLQGLVLDRHRQPVAYATVAVEDTGLFTVTDTSGYFALAVPAGSHLIRISHISYQARQFSADSLRLLLQTTGHVVLREQVRQLDEIVILKKKQKYNLLGDSVGHTGIDAIYAHNAQKVIPQLLNDPAVRQSASTSFVIHGFECERSQARHYHEIGRIITLGKKPFTVEKIGFVLARNEYENLLLRLQLYEVINGKPGKPLLGPGLVTAIGSKKKVVEIALSAYDITLHSDVLVTVTFLKPEIDPRKLSFVAGHLREKRVYYRTNYDKAWFVSEGVGLAVYMKGWQ